MKIWLDEVRAPSDFGYFWVRTIEDLKDSLIRAKKRKEYFEKQGLIDTPKITSITEINLCARGLKIEDKYREFFIWFTKENKGGRIDGAKILFKVHSDKEIAKQTVQNLILKNKFRYSEE